MRRWRWPPPRPPGRKRSPPTPAAPTAAQSASASSRSTPPPASPPSSARSPTSSAARSTATSRSSSPPTTRPRSRRCATTGWRSASSARSATSSPTRSRRHEAVATYAGADGTPSAYTAGIVTWPGSGITKLDQVAGKTFAYSDPASTSGHLEPAYALKQIGINPDTGIRALWAGSHAASFETIRNHKVQAGELNSQQIISAELAGEYKAADYVELWRSQPIPLDPISIRADLPEPFKSKLVDALQHLDLSSLSADDLKLLGSGAHTLVPQTDAAYDGVRDLVKVLDIDLTKVNG